MAVHYLIMLVLFPGRLKSGGDFHPEVPHNVEVAESRSRHVMNAVSNEDHNKDSLNPPTIAKQDSVDNIYPKTRFRRKSHERETNDENAIKGEKPSELREDINSVNLKNGGYGVRRDDPGERVETYRDNNDGAMAPQRHDVQHGVEKLRRGHADENRESGNRVANERVDKDSVTTAMPGHEEAARRARAKSKCSTVCST